MLENKEISEKERARREKIRKAWFERREKKRREGYALWLKEKHKEMLKRKKKEDKKKAKEKELKRIERERLKEERRIEKAKEKKKRPVGRPKKRGPKKKRKSRAKKVYKVRPVFDFKIIGFHNGKQCGFFGKYRTSEQAYDALGILIKESDNIIFPKVIDNNEILGNCRYEYIILEKNRQGDKENIRQRNEYGKFVEHKLNSDKWVIIEKVKYNVEETFWVWGCNPNTERKDFLWIYENKIINDLDEDYALKRVFIYKNKIIIRNDDDFIDIIFCKTPSDAIRFYNIVEERLKKDRKNRKVYCMGSLNTPGERKKKIEKEIAELTGWPIEKVQQSYTKKHHKNN